MNLKEQYNDGLLRSFIGNDREKTVPEGFTAKVMSRIQLEKVPVPARKRINPVPVVSVGITGLLIILALLIPESGSIAIPWADLLDIINLKFPEIKDPFSLEFKLPPVMSYVLIGVLVLALFDKAVYGTAHRKNQFNRQ